MAEFITKIRTESGELPVDYNSLANLPTLSNPNLLINSDFRNPINQRGAANYKSDANNYTRIFTVDRWNIQNGTNVTVNDASITLTGDSASNGVSMFSQILETTHVDNYVLQINVLSLTGGATVDIYNTSSTVVSTASLQVGLNKIYVSNNDILFVQINVGSSDSLEIEWVKLEQGTTATPFIPRPIAEEANMCYRYYRVGRVFKTILSDMYDAEIVESETYGIPMRAIPTLTWNVTDSYNMSNISASDNGDLHTYRISYTLSSTEGTGHRFDITIYADAEIY